MKDKVFIGFVVYFAVLSIVSGWFFWKVGNPMLALLYSIPLAGGIALAFYFKVK